MIDAPHAPVQPRAPGGDHQGADGNHRRRRGAEGVAHRCTQVRLPPRAGCALATGASGLAPAAFHLIARTRCPRCRVASLPDGRPHGCLPPINPEHPEPRKIARAVDIAREGGRHRLPDRHGLRPRLRPDEQAGDRAPLPDQGHAPRQERSRSSAPISRTSRATPSSRTQAYRILKRFLPGPYCFILPATREVPKMVQTQAEDGGHPRAEPPGRARARRASSGGRSSARPRRRPARSRFVDPWEIDERFQGLELVLDAGERRLGADDRGRPEPGRRADRPRGRGADRRARLSRGERKRGASELPSPGRRSSPGSSQGRSGSLSAAGTESYVRVCDPLAVEPLPRRRERERAPVAADEAAAEARGRDERRAAAAHEVGDGRAGRGSTRGRCARAAAPASAWGSRCPPAQRGVGDHPGNVGPHAPEPAALVGVVAVGLAVDDRARGTGGRPRRGA